MTLTKNDMARVITQALWNMPHLPPKDHHWVRKEARPAKWYVAERYTLAHKILTDRIANA
jgi:hypothetical protein|tara:strand:- start:1355 stop:1534 length:180 start_codon:yes stop_codon:yes gene_type:complete